jgi:hypothetical protein
MHAGACLEPSAARLCPYMIGCASSAAAVNDQSQLRYCG